MKEALKEEIGVWKENLKAVIYLTVLDISATVAHIYKSGISNLWSFAGLLSIGALRRRLAEDCRSFEETQ